MRGLFVVLLCATVGYCVQGRPQTDKVDTVDASLDDGVKDSVVESTGVREAKELPVPGRFQGGFIKPQTRINPFLVKSQPQYQTRSGGFFKQQLGVQQVGSQIQPSGGLIHQQVGVQPVGSQIQPSGGQIHQQLGIKPVGSQIQPSGGLIQQQLGVQPVGSQIQPSGGLIHQQVGVQPVGSQIQPSGGQIHQQLGIKPVGSQIQPSGGLIHQQVGVKPVGSQIQPSGGLIHQQVGVQSVGSQIQPSGGLIHQQSGIKPVAGGIINQQQSGLNPFLQGQQQIQTSTPGLASVQPEVNPLLPGTQQHQQHQQHQQQQIPSGVQISGGLINQQTKMLSVDSHVHDAEMITSRNAQVHVKDTLHEKPIDILSQDSDLYPDGSHFNVWESANGIKVHEEGTVKVNGNVEVQSVSGSISYTDPDGTPIHLTYIADENGFQPQGDHLPTPPPIPQSIARALEYIAAHPWVEEEHVKSPSKVTVAKEDLPIIEVA